MRSKHRDKQKSNLYKKPKGPRSRRPIRESRAWWFLAPFGLCVLVLAGISSLVVAWAKPYSETVQPGTASSQEQTNYTPSEQDCFNLLFVLAEESDEMPQTCLLLRFDPVNRLLPVLQVPVQLQVEENGRSATFAQVFAYGGVKQAAGALSRACGIPVDRYIVCGRPALSETTKQLGQLKYDVPSGLPAKGEGSAVLQPGLQMLDGDGLFSLLVCRDELGQPAVPASTIAAAYINQRFLTASSGAVEQAFKKGINLVDSNISYSDFKAWQTPGRVFAQTPNCAKGLDTIGAFTGGGASFAFDGAATAMFQTYFGGTGQ